ncbi:MAG: LytTR family transcriptional regulator DNA-binding domain-containing protein [Bacteroidota bacterium]
MLSMLWKVSKNDAIDYLLKPVSFECFYKAVEKVQVILNGLAEKAKSTTILTKEKEVNHIFVKTEYKLVRVNVADILYVEGLQNYVMIYTATEKITSLQTLKKPKSSYLQISLCEFINLLF